MSNPHSEQMPAKDDGKPEDLKRDQGVDSTTEQKQELNRPNGQRRSLSKREIMEQLSRERFPWDE
jgi:hypothetical protein